MTKGNASDRIVVGVDGSAGARAALEWAAAEAKLRGVVLRVICSWFISAEVYAAAVSEATFDGFRENAEAIVRDALAQVERLAPEIEVDGQVSEGQAADVLLREGETAALLVVGSRGHSGIASALLGSVSRRVAEQASCPVLVAR